MGLCNWEPSLSTHNAVVVLAWLTRLTKTLITVASPLGWHAQPFIVMSSILIPLIILVLDHSDGLSRVERLKLTSRFVL